MTTVIGAAEEAIDRAFSHEEDQLGMPADVSVRGRWIRGDVLGDALHEVADHVAGS
ncbi:hypothetical protein [Streptomyces sp. JV178]|uniref:hypothetical protein n=1 Tax=Streptomyces sp. JV178 TaxID=858632 RepID=UPI0015D55498|nr:hypothetical protein [Streptomyces sp. JV178]